MAGYGACTVLGYNFSVANKYFRERTRTQVEDSASRLYIETALQPPLDVPPFALCPLPFALWPRLSPLLTCSLSPTAAWALIGYCGASEAYQSGWVSGSQAFDE
jgi:hypothetical protein